MIELFASRALSLRRKNSTGSSSRRSPARRITVQASAASFMVARGSPSTWRASSPSSSCASIESVPRTPLKRVAHAKAPSLVSCAPPMAPTPSGPLFIASLRSSAVVESASPQLTATSSPPFRTKGSLRRRRGSTISRSSFPSSGPLTPSKPKRPLSHNQLWFTGSASIPRSRVNRPEDDCTATRQPTAHPVQVDSTCSKSHGRAANRYGVAVKAPTGQI